MDKLIADIEHMRQYRGYSKRELAAKVNITEEYYWKIVNGKATAVAYKVLSMLGDEVGIKISHFIDASSIIVAENSKFKGKKV